MSNDLPGRRHGSAVDKKGSRLGDHDSRVLIFLIGNGPVRSESELAEAIFRKEGYHQQVKSDCNLLLNRGYVERRGEGGPSDPYRYYSIMRLKFNWGMNYTWKRNTDLFSPTSTFSEQ